MRIKWDSVGARTYETGLDRGVLYLNGTGYAWNGLTGLDENPVDETNVPVYIDTLKVRDIPVVGTYGANLKAYTYPDEFMVCEGVQEINDVLVDGQPPVMFGLSYRTCVGNDVEGVGYGHRIHVVYNATAIPDTATYQTLSLSPEPTEFGWSISAVPALASGYRPTAHIIFDTRFLSDDMIKELEDVLYGTDTTNPALPPIDYFIGWAQDWGLLTIIDHGDGTWSAIDEGEYISMINADTFQINAPTVVILDSVTYRVSTIPG